MVQQMQVEGCIMNRQIIGLTILLSTGLAGQTSRDPGSGAKTVDPHEDPNGPTPVGPPRSPAPPSKKVLPVPVKPTPEITVGSDAPAASDRSQRSAADLIIGEWVMVAEKSHYQPGPAPKRQVRIYTRTPAGVQASVTTVQADGSSETVSYLCNEDGKEYPVTGSTRVDHLSMQKIDAYTSAVTLRHASKVTAMARRKIADDGKSMTIEVIDKTSEEEPKSATVFYEKQ
jgi:hypothetical protein